MLSIRKREISVQFFIKRALKQLENERTRVNASGIESFFSIHEYCVALHCIALLFIEDIHVVKVVD